MKAKTPQEVYLDLEEDREEARRHQLGPAWTLFTRTIGPAFAGWLVESAAPGLIMQKDLTYALNRLREACPEMEMDQGHQQQLMNSNAVLDTLHALMERHVPASRTERTLCRENAYNKLCLTMPWLAVHGGS